MLSAQVFTCLVLCFSTAVKCFWCGCIEQAPLLAPYTSHNKMFLLSCFGVFCTGVTCPYVTHKQVCWLNHWE